MRLGVYPISVVFLPALESHMLKPPRLRGTHRYLAPGERILLTTRRHPIVLVKPVIRWMATLIAVGLISFILTEGNPIPLLDQIVLWLALAMTAHTAYKALAWWRSYYVVTDQRVLLVRGILSVDVEAVSLARVTETGFSRTVWGRLLGYGELRLEAAGEQLHMARLTHLPRAGQAYRLVNSLLLGEELDPEPFDPSEEVTGPLPPVVL